MDHAQTARICLEQIRRNIPEALAFVESLGDRTLGELSAEARTGKADALQNGEDLIALARGMASRPLSPEYGRKLARALEDSFCALTANHLGSDFHPEFAQGNLIFALHALKGKAPAIPVLAWGCVSGNSFGYPRGLLLGRGKPGSARPGRFPVLPDTHRHTPLSLREAFVLKPVRLLRDRAVLTSPDCGPLTPAETGAVRRLLGEVFCSARVLAQKSYGEQAVVMHSLLWERLFAPGFCPPPLVALDMTLLSLELIRADLRRPHSLIRCLLEPGMPEVLFTELNGIRGCWRMGEEAACSRGGSFLFWGISRDRRFLPLAPDAAYRRLICADGAFPGVDLTPAALEEALAGRTLLPGLFLSFTALALARGLVCRGGVFQTGYLPAMRRGLARALARRGESALAAKLAGDGGAGQSMMTGYLPLRCRPPLPGNRAEGGEPSYAASPVDIAARGGLTPDLAERLAALPARPVFMRNLAFLYEDLVPAKERLPGWFPSLAGNYGIFLE